MTCPHTNDRRLWLESLETRRMLAFTIGMEFTAGSGPGAIPPDTMGAVGPNDIVELINGRYAVYDKTGVEQTATSLNQFWMDSGVTPDGDSFDPRVFYDTASGRFFAAAVDNAENANNFLVAVSSTNDPAAGWSGFQIDSDTDDSHWADFPMLGLNNEAVTISANMFGLAGADATTSFLVIPKSDLLAGAPTVANATLFENVDGGDTGFSAQPIVDLDGGSLPQSILSSFNKPAGSLKTSSVGGTPLAPTLDTAGGFINVTARDAPLPIDQPGGKVDIDAGNNRFSGNVVQQQIPGRFNPSLWGVHSVEIGGRAAIEWYEIDAVTNALVQSGTISDSNLAFNYPSITVNDFGEVVVGFSGGDPNTFISTYVTVGHTAAGVTTFDPVTQTHAGVADYENLDSDGRNRWGDYSATVLDPTDQRRIWTFQEFVSATDEWSIRVTEIILSRPPEITNLAVNPAIVNEGEAVSLTIDFDDPEAVDTHTVEIDWGDGSPNTVVVTGGGGGPYQVMANHTYEDDHPLTGTPADVLDIVVTVTDSSWVSDDATTSVTVNNVDPVIIDFASNATFADKAAVGEPVNILANFTDAGILDTHTAVVDWGDGTVEMVTVNQGAGVGTVTGSHAYAMGGIFDISLTLTDDDTGNALAMTTAVVSGVGLTPAGILQVIGTGGNDRTTIARTGNSLRVFADFLANGNFETFNANDVVKIVAYLCDGHDYFVINNNVAQPAIVHGGAGNDLVKGGLGPTVLLGEEGNDRLIGGRGRDILIGGLGADLVMGGLGEDILVAGTTTHDNNDMALMDLITEWNENDPYSVRVDRLRNGTGATGVQLAMGVTVFDDLESDRLVGSFGTDWFFFDPLEDVAPDRRNNEEAN